MSRVGPIRVWTLLFWCCLLVVGCAPDSSSNSGAGMDVDGGLEVGGTDVGAIDADASDPPADVEDARDVRPGPDVSDPSPDVRDVGGDAFDGSIFFPDDIEEGSGGDVTAPPPPEAEELVPSRGPTTGGTLVTVYGAGFTSDIDVLVDGRRMAWVDVVSAWELQFLTEPSDAGLRSVKLVNRGGSVSVVPGFTFQSSLTVRVVQPSSGRAEGGDLVRVEGSGFRPDTRFLFGDREARVVGRVEEGAVQVQVPPGVEGTTGAVVAWDDRFARLAGAFTWSRRAPSLLRVVPPEGRTAGGDAVRLDGYGLDTDCEAWIDGRSSPVLDFGDGSLGVVTPPGEAGVADVSIDCGTRGATLVRGGYAYVDGTERDLTGVWPDSGLTRGGEAVTLHGFGLADVTEVKVGAELAEVRERTERTVVFASPEIEAGVWDVTATFADGSTRVLPRGWRAYRMPMLTEVSPAVGPTAGGWEAEARGTDLEGISRLLVDGRDVGVFSRIAGRMSFVVPGGPPGPAALAFEVGPLRVDSGLRITFGGALRWDRFFPESGTTAGGTRVYVVGDGFSSRCAITIDDARIPTEVLGSSVLVGTTPPHAAGTARLGVVGCADGMTWRSPSDFLYTSPARAAGGVRGGGIDGELRVAVREFGSFAPVEGATVMVGTRADSPFIAVTGPSGNVSFVDDRLRGRQTVTAWAANRSTESYVNVDAREVTIMLNPLPNTSPPCDPVTDPECTLPPPEPLGTVYGFLRGLTKIADFPPGTRPYAIVDTTRRSPGWTNPDNQGSNRLEADGPFELTTRIGDMAIIALCGYQYVQTTDTGTEGDFVPLRMGVIRGVTIRPGDPPLRTTIECDIPLDSRLLVKIPNGPELLPETGPVEWPQRFAVKVNLDFSGEGYFEDLPSVSTRTPEVLLARLPALRGDLAGVLADITAGAYPRGTTLPSSVSYLDRLAAFDTTVEVPGLLPVPEFVMPGETAIALDGGYVEWTLEPGSRAPDFYQVIAQAGNGSFSRWSVMVPGWQTSFNFADFPDFFPGTGAPVGGPSGQAEQYLYLYVRALDVHAFDFDDFDRYVFNARNVRAISTTYRNFVFPVAAPVP